MRIKNAVSAEPSGGGDTMEPSIMNGNSEYEPGQTPPLYTPKTQEIGHGSEEYYSPQQPQAQEFDENMQAPMYEDYAQEEYAPQEGYAEQGMPGNYDTDTIIEITEQVFSEKIKKEQKQIEALNEFATLAETRMSDNHERLKKIESIIDKLQIAILEKISSYGRNVDSIKNEMEMMQESFEKMVPSVHERNYKKEEKSREHAPARKRVSRTKK